MGAVVDPFPRRRDLLPGRDNGGVDDDRHEIAMAADLDTQNTEPVIGIVEHHPLDEASQNLLARRFRLSLGRAGHNVLIAVAVNNVLIISKTRRPLRGGRRVFEGRIVAFHDG